MRTITLGFEDYRGGPDDEVPLAELMARHCSTDHTSQWISSGNFRLEVDRLIEAMDQPSIDGLNTYLVCKVASESGLKVALSGVGGDELFGGYPSFETIPKLVRRATLLSRLPGANLLLRSSGKVIGGFSSPKYAGLLDYGGSYPGAYFLRHALFMPWELPQLLDPDVVAEGLLRLDTLKDIASTMPRTQSARLIVAALTSQWYMRNQLLRDADWASMAHSLELRTPLVDVPLWETVVSLLKAGHSVNKDQLARSPASPLPDAIMQRRKTGFSIPVAKWLKEAGSIPDRGAGLSRGLRGWASFLYERGGYANA